MSTEISFKAKVKVGGEIVPIASEIVFGADESQDGVQNGFLFKLDLEKGDPPVSVNLGNVIQFVEEKLGAGTGNLAKNPALPMLTQAFGSSVASGGTFNASNPTLVNIYEFTINSSATKKLFSFNIDIAGADPTKGLIALPGELAKWVKIETLSISFSATTTNPTPGY